MEMRGLSIKTLAASAGIDQASIDAFRRGRREPDAEDLMRLAGSLEVPVRDLLSGIRWVPDGKGGGEYRVEQPKD